MVVRERRAGRQAARGLRRAARRASAVAPPSCAPAPQAQAARATWCRRRSCGWPALPLTPERQGRPPRAARAGRGASADRRSCRRARRWRQVLAAIWARGARRGAGGRPRQLLRAGRRLDPEHPGRVAVPPGRAPDHHPADLRAPHGRRAGARSSPRRPALRTRRRVLGEVPLTPIQRWFFDRSIRSSRTASTSPSCSRSAGPWCRRLLDQALAALAAHHDALRLRFARRDGAWHQELTKDTGASWPLSCETLSSPGELAARASAIAASLDLERGPTARAALLDIPGQASRLLLTVHHLVVDGVSWRILADDLELAYRQLESRRAGPAPAQDDLLPALGLAAGRVRELGAARSRGGVLADGARSHAPADGRSGWRQHRR